LRHAQGSSPGRRFCLTPLVFTTLLLAIVFGQTPRASAASELYLPVMLRSYQIPWHCGAEPANDAREGACGPLAFGQIHYNYISSPADKYDWFYFDLPVAHAIEAWLTGIPAGNDYELYLMGRGRDPLGISNLRGNQNEHIPSTPLPAGRYYLVVFPADGGGWDPSSPYALRVAFALQAGDTKPLGQTGITLVYVPAGEFWMGSADSDPDASSD
jgi:hypothetical protein